MTTHLRTARARVAWLVLAVVLVGVAVVVLLVNPDRTAAVAADTPAAAAPAVAPMAAQAQLVAHAAPTRPAPAVPHDDVAAAAPTGFRIVGPKFDIPAKVCSMANVRPLDPPGDQYHTVCWVKEGFGVAPGTAPTGTSYILGHSWAQAPLVLTPLSTTAMASMDLDRPVPLAGVPTFPTTALNGYRVVLTTPNGVLTYTVDSAYAVNKQRAADVAPLMAERTPNRLVIITCGVNRGVDVDVNIIVNATLTSSQATA